MKTQKQWLAIPAALVMALGISGAALSQPVAITKQSAPVQLSGTSGGGIPDNSCAKFIASSPNHVVQVTEDMNLRFTLQAAGQPALLIRNSTGKDFCVPSDSFSNGKVVIPGRWVKGTYDVFVGDLANQPHPYTLSITR